MLNILERYPIGTLGWNTPETVHFMVEAERRVYADRAQYLGDPDFIKIPVEQLISKEYANKRAQDIQQDKATPSEQVSYGEIKFTDTESKETTHYSVVDKNGMAVAVTTTLNGGYGSYLVVDGAGFLLNNEMDDFSIKPGEPNMYGLTGSEANAIAPGKRMLSSMTPTIIVKNGKPFMVVGSPGGSTIMTTVLQVVMNVIDHGKTIQEAVSTPRFHHQWLPDKVDYEREAFTDSTMARLTAMGYTLKLQRGSIGDAHSIIIDPVKKLLYGGADPRSSSSSSAGR
jgi:gamma-glutamyltranspeptidase/glutathione hydrolase